MNRSPDDFACGHRCCSASRLSHAALNVLACEPEWAALAARARAATASRSAAPPRRRRTRTTSRPGPSLIARMRNADLLVCTGMELEAGWLPLLVQQSGNGRVAPGAARLLRGRPPSSRALDVPARLDRGEGDVHAAGNPHIQLDPRNIAQRGRPRWPGAWPSSTRRAPAAIPERHQAFAARWSEAQRKWEQQAAAAQGVAGGRAPQATCRTCATGSACAGRLRWSPSRASSRARRT